MRGRSAGPPQGAPTKSGRPSALPTVTVSDSSGTTIVRVWRGTGSTDGVARYCEEHFPRRVLPALRDVDGFLEARVLVRSAESTSEVVVMTTWASLDAVKAFAGEGYRRAVVEPEVRGLLEHVDEEATHFTIAHDVR